MRALQHVLTLRGYPLAADGVFGQQTHAMVMAFQGASGLKADGVAGERTLSTLAKPALPLKSLTSAPVTTIRAVQELLILHRTWSPRTGMFDVGTQQAILAFKKRSGLHASLDLDSPMLNALLERRP